MDAKIHAYISIRGSLAQAISSLAEGTGSIQDRLINACQSRLIPLRVEDFPPELQDDVRWIKDTTTSAEPTNDAEKDMGTLRLTVERMTDEQAQEVAQKILHVESMLGGIIEDMRNDK